RDQVAQVLDLVGDRFAAAEENLDDLFQPEHPEGQVERAGIDADRLVGERAGKLVVRVEDQDAQVGPRGDGLADQQRHGGRLADTGRAHHREVAVERVVDGDAGGDAVV